ARYATATAYDSNDNVRRTCDDLNRATDIDYDNLNRKISEMLPPVDDDNNSLTAMHRPTTTYDYDINSNLIATVDALGNLPGETPADHQTDTVYDALNRNIQVTSPAAFD